MNRHMNKNTQFTSPSFACANGKDVDRALIGRGHQILAWQMTNIADVKWPTVTQLTKSKLLPMVFAPDISIFRLSKLGKLEILRWQKPVKHLKFLAKPLKNQESCHTCINYCRILSVLQQYDLEISSSKALESNHPQIWGPEDLREKLKGQKLARQLSEMTCTQRKQSSHMKHYETLRPRTSCNFKKVGFIFQHLSTSETWSSPLKNAGI